MIPNRVENRLHLFYDRDGALPNCVLESNYAICSGLTSLTRIDSINGD